MIKGILSLVLLILCLLSTTKACNLAIEMESLKTTIEAKKAEIKQGEADLAGLYQTMFNDRVLPDIKHKIEQNDFTTETGNCRKVVLDLADYLKEQDVAHLTTLYSVIRQAAQADLKSNSGSGGEFSIGLELNKGEVKMSLVFRF